MTTLTEYFPDFEDSLYGIHLRRSSVDTYLRHVNSLVQFLGKDADITMLTTRNIQDYQSALGKRKCGAATIGNHLTAIRSFCRYLINKEVLDVDPTNTIKWPRHADRRVRVLSHKEVQKLFNVIAEPDGLTDREKFIWQRNRRAIFIMYYSGLRLGETCALCWKDVSLDDGLLLVREGKGGRQRNVPIHPALAAELRKVQGCRPSWAVVGGANHKAILPKSMHHLFDRWLPQWDIFITAHQLRRTFATHMMRSNAKLRDIQLLLGHAKLSTSDSYLDSNAQERSDSVNLLPSYQ